MPREVVKRHEWRGARGGDGDAGDVYEGHVEGDCRAVRVRRVGQHGAGIVLELDGQFDLQARDLQQGRCIGRGDGEKHLHPAKVGQVDVGARIVGPGTGWPHVAAADRDRKRRRARHDRGGGSDLHIRGAQHRAVVDDFLVGACGQRGLRVDR